MNMTPTNAQPVTLYKKDSANRIRVLIMYTQGPNLIQESGLLNGGLVSNTRECKPKNIGKANATTAEEQAILELQSKTQEKLKEGYFYTELEAQNTQVLLPMLAKEFNNFRWMFPHHMQHAFVQPKLDGMRALGVTGKNARLVSRKGVDIETLPHIIDELKRIPGLVTLDGELYAHGLNFQANMKLIKKNRGVETEQIRYHVYDLVSKDPFHKRDFKQYIKECKYILAVPTTPVNRLEDLNVNHEMNIMMGYEGTMVRWGTRGYELNTRDEQLLKLKDHDDICLELIDVVPADRRPDWGKPVYRTAEGREFSTGIRFSIEEKKDLLKNKDQYIGQFGEIRHFGFTDDNIPRNPITVGFRLDKTEADATPAAPAPKSLEDIINDVTNVDFVTAYESR